MTNVKKKKKKKIFQFLIIIISFACMQDAESLIIVMPFVRKKVGLYEFLEQKNGVL